MSNKFSPIFFGIYVSSILTLYRYICIFYNWDLSYFNDILYFLVFGFAIIFYQRKNESSSFLQTIFKAGAMQIFLTIAFYESTKIIIFQPILNMDYWLNRIIVSVTILALGFSANILSLFIYFLIKNKSFRKTVKNSDLIDN